MICKQCNEWFEDPRHIPNNLRPQDYPKVNVFTNKCDLHEVLNLKTLSNIKNTGDVNNYVQGSIEDRKLTFLVDTGADISLLSITTFENLDSKSYKIMPLDRFHILGVGKSMQNVKTKFLLKFKLGKTNFEHTFYLHIG